MLALGRACGRFPGSYSRAVVDSHADGTKKGNVVRALPEATAAPATVSGELHSISHWSLWILREGGGKAATREPGDLSTTPTATTPSGGKAHGGCYEPTSDLPHVPRRGVLSFRNVRFRPSCHGRQDSRHVH